MHNLKQRRTLLLKLRFLFLFGISVAAVHAAESGASTPASSTDASKTVNGQFWSPDYTGALRRAKQTHKPLLVYFSGSTWCGFCKKMNAEIISKEEFRSFARSNFELVNLDFPRGKPQTEEEEFNSWLKAQHGVSGFPTMLVIDGDGIVWGKVGYSKDGPKKTISSLKEIIEQNGGTLR